MRIMMKWLRACATGVLSMLPLSVVAQDFPSKPVRLVVPFPAGGTIDTVARLIAEKMRSGWSQPVIVENRAGGNGAVGVDFVAKSPPDGHTLLVHAFLLVTVPHLQKTPYDVPRDFVGVAQTIATQYALMTTTKSGLASWNDVVSEAKKQPGKLNYGSGGNGSAQHLYVELARSIAGIALTHIPYKGNALAIQGLLAGDIDLLFDPTNTVIPMVQSGKARALLVTGQKPLDGLPGTPTFDSVFPGMSIDGWHGVFAPSATPQPVIEHLSTAVSAAVRAPEIAERFRQMGFEASGLPTGEFNAVMRRDYARWGKLIRDNGIRPD